MFFFFQIDDDSDAKQNQLQSQSERQQLQQMIDHSGRLTSISEVVSSADEYDHDYDVAIMDGNIDSDIDPGSPIVKIDNQVNNIMNNDDDENKERKENCINNMDSDLNVKRINRSKVKKAASITIAHRSQVSEEISSHNIQFIFNNKYIQLMPGDKALKTDFKIKFRKRESIKQEQTCIINCNNQKILTRSNISFRIKRLYTNMNRNGKECEQYIFEYGLILIKKNSYDLKKFESFFQRANEETGLFSLEDRIFDKKLGINKENFAMYFIYCHYDVDLCKYGFYVRNVHDTPPWKSLYVNQRYSIHYSFKTGDTISVNLINRKQIIQGSANNGNSNSISNNGIGNGNVSQNSNIGKKASINKKNLFQNANSKRKMNENIRRVNVLTFVKNKHSIPHAQIVIPHDLKQYDCFYALTSMGLSTFEGCV